MCDMSTFLAGKAWAAGMMNDGGGVADGVFWMEWFMA